MRKAFFNKNLGDNIHVSVTTDYSHRDDMDGAKVNITENDKTSTITLKQYEALTGDRSVREFLQENLETMWVKIELGAETYTITDGNLVSVLSNGKAGGPVSDGHKKYILDLLLGSLEPAREQIVCKDGFKMSVQAGTKWRCEPPVFDNGGFFKGYTHVEVGLFGGRRESLLSDLYPGMSFDDEIYPLVPVQVVMNIINKHGGLQAGNLPRMDFGANK